jgi:hypothetical protein
MDMRNGMWKANLNQAGQRLPASLLSQVALLARMLHLNLLLLRLPHLGGMGNLLGVSCHLLGDHTT